MEENMNNEIGAKEQRRDTPFVKSDFTVNIIEGKVYRLILFKK